MTRATKAQEIQRWANPNRDSIYENYEIRFERNEIRFGCLRLGFDSIRDLRDSIWAAKDLGPNHEADGSLGRPMDVNKNGGVVERGRKP